MDSSAGSAAIDSGPRHFNPTRPVRPLRQHLPWAELLRRVFAVDVLVCPRCLGPMTVLAALSDPPVLAKILTHLGLPSTSPALAPARRRGQLHLFDELSEGAADGATEPWETLGTPHRNMKAGPSRAPPPDELGGDQDELDSAGI